jgi:hypothetical protein
MNEEDEMEGRKTGNEHHLPSIPRSTTGIM